MSSLAQTTSSKAKKKKEANKESADFAQIESIVGFSLESIKDPINAYLLAVFLTGVIQFTYCILVGTFPFNAFLSGFLSCVTSFVLAVCLKINGEKSFKSFLFAHLVLHLAVLNFIG